MSRPTKYDGLLHDVCVGMGYCGSVTHHVSDLLPKSGSVNAKQFALLVFEAENNGRKSSTYIHHDHFPVICDLFKKHFGHGAVAASRLK